MININSFEYADFIGRKKDDSQLKIFLGKLGGKTDFESNGTQLGHLVYKEKGVCFTFEDENMFQEKEDNLSGRFILVAIMFFSEDTQGYREFKDELPFGIKFSMTARQIRDILGDPFANGGGGRSRFLGEIPKWEKFKLTEDYIIHIQYKKDVESIDLLTLTKEEFDVNSN